MYESIEGCLSALCELQAQICEYEMRRGACPLRPDIQDPEPEGRFLMLHGRKLAQGKTCLGHLVARYRCAMVYFLADVR